MKEIAKEELLKRDFIFSYNSAHHSIHIGRYILVYYKNPKYYITLIRVIKGNDITKEMLEYGRENN